ncbi:MAG: radical SAM protein [Prevotella sp.]|nr:radical SAM protein [Prevotella sp.]
MGHRKDIFRYRIVTNLNCNMNESTGPNGNCYFCYQKYKANRRLDIDKCRDTMRKIGILKRATIMGGEAILNPQLPDFIRLAHEYVTNDVCLVTNGILMTEDRARLYADAGLSEVAISVSSLEQYQRRREAALRCKSYIWNTRINIPKCKESTGDKLVELLREVLTDGFYCVVCEDLQGRYGDFDFQQKMGTIKIKDDGFGFYDYMWQGHQFGVFGNYAKYNDCDIVITPLGNFCSWEKYCAKVENVELNRKESTCDRETIEG